MFLTPNRVPVALGKPLTSLRTVFIGTIFNENFKILCAPKGGMVTEISETDASKQTGLQSETSTVKATTCNFLEEDN